MDAIDRQIIALLGTDSRMSATEIGKRVHRSRVAVMSRIDALVASGEIASFGVTLKRKPWPVLFEIAMRSAGTCEVLVPRFRASHPFNKAWSVTGSSDLFIWTEAETAADVHTMRDYLQAQPEVARVSTHSIIRTYE
ncbi:Lrp/AsnC family transcriptional regulator [Paraburkholderia caballeronis]|uniref:Lrp/AsnC family transcriptional regulator n=1 Tax=Paraburkholderia caballeronis TaxID=416943 RepID=UPI001064BAB2|nr:Lrp/AsnC family transcriptional regulator [Paraburkholderia caballeronis]TDV09529.1 AsnC family transcriptional regulator [Paraburkholderia caballeronis]TDV13800.1 AsnC family transcriptional regulator [Paraburkholderia caballeronis]TDV22982.1 AsnC family transcriptional regulator [Paraburkholderia caballeronis]